MKALHLISFDIPYPPDYGGAIDVFYKIKALAEAGTEIHLHCSEYGRKRSPELEKICKTVHYYPRKKGFLKLFRNLPYIVATRKNKNLLKILQSDQAPILFEGLHSCAFLNSKALKKRLKLVRTHNIEHDYYAALAKAEKNLLRKIFFQTEAFKLKRYEKILHSADAVLSISEKDKKHFSKYKNARLLPAFHEEISIQKKSKRGEGIVYHGNLSVGENIQAVLYLIENVFAKIKHPVIIAGRNPDKKLRSAAEKYEHITLVANPTKKEMEAYISNAQINILITFQATGIKLKLLNALTAGRFCICNSAMTAGTGLESLCNIADKPEDLIRLTNQLYTQNFDEDGHEYEKRKTVFEKLFSNQKGAGKIMSVISALEK
jgi:hypothetical protein